MTKRRRRGSRLAREAAREFRGFPVGTVAFYGPDDRRASKVAVGIVPHEEGIDYPQGEACPQCPFWANRDRFTQEEIQ